jgi:hypothetical protein
LTQSGGGGGGEYSLGTATLTLRGDMQPLEKDLARMRQVIADMEKRGTNIPAPNIPPPSPEAQRGYEGLLKTLERLRGAAQGDGEAFKMLGEQLRGAGQAAGGAGGAGGFGGAGGHGRQHVALGHPAILAGTSDRAGGQLVIGHQLGSRRHGNTGHRSAGCRRRCGRSSGRCSGGGSGSSRTRPAFTVDSGNELLGHHRAAVGDKDFSQHASAGRRHFKHHLVCLDLDQDLVLRHGVTGLFLPGKQGRFGDRFGQLRNLYFNDSHFFIP